jgi:hypothetical protein
MTKFGICLRLFFFFLLMILGTIVFSYPPMKQRGGVLKITKLHKVYLTDQSVDLCEKKV